MPLETRAARRQTPAWAPCLLVIGLLSVGLLPALVSLARADSSAPAGKLEWRQATRTSSRQGFDVSTVTSEEDLPRAAQYPTGQALSRSQVADSTWDPPAESEDPLHDDALWENDPPAATDLPRADQETEAETVAAATIELVNHHGLARADRRQALQLPGEADRSIRVSVLDDPFDDAQDPFEEPLIDEAGEGEAGAGEAVEEEAGNLGDQTLEDRDERLESEEDLTELEQAEEAVDREWQRRQQEEDEPQPTDPIPSNPFDDDPLEDDSDQSLAAPSPAAAPAGSTPSTLKPIESGGPNNRQPERPAEARPESGREDFSADPLGRTPEEKADEVQLEKDMMAKELTESEKNCDEEFAQLRSARIDSIDLNIRVAGKPGEDYPYECSLGSDRFSPRSWPPTTYLWKASGLCHKPLYFEQVPLERYGHSWGPYLQPLVSGAHFFASVPILPYKMGLKTPHECVYSLGYYRPGSCAPYLLDAVPFTWRAALYEAGFVVGAAAVIP